MNLFRRARRLEAEVRWNGKCARCGEPSDDGEWMMSHFDMAPICLACVEVEKGHPYFEEAVRQEDCALRRGESTYAGVGLPADLRRR